MHAANSAAEPRPIRTPAEAAELTRLYPSLLGLRFAPIWAYFAVFFFIDAFTPLPLESPYRVWPLIPAIVLSAIAHRDLNRTFGVVRTVSVGTGVAIIVVAVIAFYALQIVSLATLRVDLTGIAFGLMALASVFSHKQFRHWLVPAAIALLQPFVFPHQTPDHHTSAASAWWGMYWTACTLACLWNHRLLVRSFSDGRTE